MALRQTKTKERLLEYFAYRKLRPAKIDMQLGKTAGFISRTRNPTSETLENILSVYDDLSAEWLLRGIGEMVRSTNEIVSTIQAATGTRILQEIPLYDTRTLKSLTTVVGQTSSSTNGFFMLPDMPKCDGALYVRGDALSPRVNAGDIVGFKVIERKMSNIIWGEMYLVELAIGGESFLVPCIICKSNREEPYIRLTFLKEGREPKDMRLADVQALAIVKFTLSVNTIK